MQNFNFALILKMSFIENVLKKIVNFQVRSIFTLLRFKTNIFLKGNKSLRPWIFMCIKKNILFLI
jgi:hypothetical protein